MGMLTKCILFFSSPSFEISLIAKGCNVGDFGGHYFRSCEIKFVCIAFICFSDFS